MSNRINIAMWSGPRNLSTALMRSFGNRKDILEVLDEPFYASYLKETKKKHPMFEEILNLRNQIKTFLKKSSIYEIKSNAF